MSPGFKDTDPANLRGIADWIDGVLTPKTEAERVIVTDVREGLRRVADTIEDGAAVPPVPEWRI